MNNNTGHSANNNKHFNYFSKQVTKITVKTSIDLIKLSNIDYAFFEEIDNEIKSYGYTVERDYYLKKGKYRRKREYIDDKSKIDFIYDHKANNDERNIPNILILHDPTKEIMEVINKILSKFYINPKIMKIELAWDYFAKGISAFEFKECLEKHLCLRYARNNSFRFKTTYYTNNIRKSSKGVRVYPDKITESYPVRVELEIHRSKIKDLKIPFLITEKSLDIDFTKMFCFKKIDAERLIKSEVKKTRKDIAMADIRRPKMGQIILRTIEAYVDAVMSGSLMEGLEILRSKDHGVDGYGRFLVPLEKETALINEAVLRQGFVREKFSFEKHGGFYRL